jgi:betaine-homocysteine S-methyltransferase
MNRQALEIARRVARETGTLFAGDLSNTNLFVPGDRETIEATRAMFEEQTQWAVDAGVDFIIAETFSHGAEALLALEVIKETGMPSVITMSIHRPNVTSDGWTPEDTCKRLQDAGADVVGLNCARGPRTMLPLLQKIRDAVTVHVAALPVPYRTNEEEPTFQSLTDPYYPDLPDGRPFPEALDPFTCNRYEIADFARDAYAIGVRYLGVCCGAGPQHIRAMAEALGRTPPASKYTTDMSKHAFFGTDPHIHREYQELAAEL